MSKEKQMSKVKFDERQARRKARSFKYREFIKPENRKTAEMADDMVQIGRSIKKAVKSIDGLETGGFLSDAVFTSVKGEFQTFVKNTLNDLQKKFIKEEGEAW